MTKTLTAEIAEQIFNLSLPQGFIRETFQSSYTRAEFDAIYGEGVADAILEQWIDAAPE